MVQRSHIAVLALTHVSAVSRIGGQRCRRICVQAREVTLKNSPSGHYLSSTAWEETMKAPPFTPVAVIKK